MKWLGYVYLTPAYFVLALSCVSFAHSEDTHEGVIGRKTYSQKDCSETLSANTAAS
jgi:hypothetical protein